MRERKIAMFLKLLPIFLRLYISRSEQYLIVSLSIQTVLLARSDISLAVLLIYFLNQAETDY